MADRYQDRVLPADDDYDRDADRHAAATAESDPLAELARLIGQTDPFVGMGRANQPVQPRNAERDQYQHPAAGDEDVATGPPPWMQRAAAPEAPPQDYPSATHPLRRYATPLAPPEPDYQQAPFAEPEPDPARYDEALYGPLDSEAHDPRRDPAYPNDPYAYDDSSEAPVRKRSGGMITIVAVLALAVVGTGAAFAYRAYVATPRSGEPPIIKAEAGPTKVVPAPADATAKVPDRMVTGDGTEKIVPREEAPVDVNSKSGARVAPPAMNPSPNPPSTASVATVTPPPAVAANGTLPNNEPRKIKTLSVRGDQPDGATTPVTSAPPAGAKAVAAARASASAANANASSANTPLSLSPQTAQPAPAAEPRTRVAATNPTQVSPVAGGGSGGYLVQVSSQRNEADAQSSYRALQGKFPAVLGSRAPVIKRADLGEKGVYYRAMVGPFGSPDEATQFCGGLKTAGGQCVVQRN